MPDGFFHLMICEALSNFFLTSKETLIEYEENTFAGCFVIILFDSSTPTFTVTLSIESPTALDCFS